MLKLIISVSLLVVVMQCAHRTETALAIVIATAAMTISQSYGQSFRVASKTTAAAKSRW